MFASALSTEYVKNLTTDIQFRQGHYCFPKKRQKSAARNGHTALQLGTNLECRPALELTVVEVRLSPINIFKR